MGSEASTGREAIANPRLPCQPTDPGEAAGLTALPPRATCGRMKAVPHDDRTQLPPELDLDLVALARSGPGPYHIVAPLPAPWIAAVLAHTDAEVTQDGRVALEVTAIGDGASYLVRGATEASYSVPCARCLAPAAVEAGGELCVHFVRDRVGGGDDRDEEDETDSPDERTFSGTRIDLGPLLTEQITVSYPMRALCARGEDCRGLCMRCGADLNAQAGAGPCEVCGAADAQVPIASEVEHEPEAPAEPTSWQAALRQLADDGNGSASGGARGPAKGGSGGSKGKPRR